MRLSKKQSIKLTILILILFFSLSIVSIKINEEEPTKQNSSKEDQSQTGSFSVTKDAQIILNNFKRSSMKDGKKQWEVIAEKGRIDPITKKSFLTNIKLSIFLDDRLIKLDAAKATLIFDENELLSAKLSKNIKLNFNNELFLETEKAVFDKKDDVVTTSSPVKITTEFMKITGDSMRIKIKDRVVNINKNVLSVITGKKKK